jgi:hypothetical protein
MTSCSVVNNLKQMLLTGADYLTCESGLFKSKNGPLRKLRLDKELKEFKKRNAVAIAVSSITARGNRIPKEATKKSAGKFIRGLLLLLSLVLLLYIVGATLLPTKPLSKGKIRDRKRAKASEKSAPATSRGGRGGKPAQTSTPAKARTLGLNVRTEARNRKREEKAEQALRSKGRASRSPTRTPDAPRTPPGHISFLSSPVRAILQGQKSADSAERPSGTFQVEEEWVKMSQDILVLRSNAVREATTIKELRLEVAQVTPASNPKIL